MGNKMRKFKLGGLGGTFDHFHRGHRLLLETAFKVADKVAIAITTEELLASKKYKEHLESYEIRAQNVLNYIKDTLRVPLEHVSIIPLNDPFGPAITDRDLEVHISSEETFEQAKMINQLRLENGLQPLVLVCIPLVLNNKQNKISSTEIRKKLDS